MAMKTVIKVTATATIAVDNEDMGSVVDGYAAANAVKALMEEKMQNVSFKTKIATMRGEPTEGAPKAETKTPANTDTGDDTEGAEAPPIILVGSDVQPAAWDAEEGRVTLGDVVARSQHESGLSPDEWNELETEEREKAISETVAAMGLKPEDAE